MSRPVRPVLVVDDEPQVRELSRRALSSVNLSCDLASDGEQAIERFESTRHDVVVTDLRMPRRHGHSLAVDLLGRPAPPSVVVVTGFVETRLADDLMSRGVQEILLKPFDYNELARKLLSLVDKNQQGATPPAASNLGSSKLAAIEAWLIEVAAISADSLAGAFESAGKVTSPPKAVDDFIDRFAKAEAEVAERPACVQKERREKERVPCSEYVTATPLNRQFAAAGEPFRAAIRDVSEGGIRLLHTRATKAEYLALTWRAETQPYSHIHLVARVTRCQPRGPFYDISGEFVLAN